MKNTEPSLRDGRPAARVSQVTPEVEALLVLLGGKGPLSAKEIRTAPGLKDWMCVRCLSVRAALAAGLIEYRCGEGKGRGRRYGLSGWGREVVRGILGRAPRPLPEEVDVFALILARSRRATPGSNVPSLLAWSGSEQAVQGSQGRS